MPSELSRFLSPARLVSRSPQGEPADRSCLLPDLSHDGKQVTFHSQATNLSDKPSSELVQDIFVSSDGGEVDILTFSQGKAGTDLSRNASMSADGRWIAFSSRARNLAPAEQVTMHEQIYLVDTQTDAIRCLTPGVDNSCTDPAISADGRFVSFTSQASNLAGEVQPGAREQVYVVDTHSGEVERISSAADGSAGNRGSGETSISGDGRLVVFRSSADNLVAGDDNRLPDVFLKDRQTGTVTLLSQGFDGSGADLGSSHPVISADGSAVVMVSNATNLIDDDIPYVGTQVYHKDLGSGRVTRVSASSAGSAGNEASWTPDISADGRFVVFTSGATNLVPDDDNDKRDIFVHDVDSGETVLATFAAEGRSTDGDSLAGAISGDGSTIAFYSDARNLLPPRLRVHGDIFAVDNPLSDKVKQRQLEAWVEHHRPQDGGGVEWQPDGLSVDGVFVERS